MTIALTDGTYSARRYDAADAVVETEYREAPDGGEVAVVVHPGTALGHDYVRTVRDAASDALLRYDPN